MAYIEDKKNMSEINLKEILEEAGLNSSNLIINSNASCSDYSLTYYRTARSDTQQDWMTLRRLRKQTGLHPFIIIDEFNYLTRVNPTEINEVIKLSEKIDGKHWLQKKLDEEGTLEEIQNKLDMSYQKKIDKMTDEITQAKEEEKEALRFNKAVLTQSICPLDSFRISYSNNRVNNKEAIKIYLFPVKKPWQVLAYLDTKENRTIYDNAKEEEHLAVMKYWYEKYNAEPAGLCCAKLEFYIDNPPFGYDDARELAFEHYAYCPNNLKISNLGSIDLLTRKLMESTVWYFSWME